MAWQYQDSVAVEGKKYFWIQKHQRKAEEYERALLQNGWERTNYVEKYTMAAFLDHDLLANANMVTNLHERGLKVFLYPHAARPSIFYAWKDHRPHPNVTAAFVMSNGAAEVMRRLDYPHPVHVIGWNYCELLPFKPVGTIGHVVFGPLHPNANGWIHDVDKETNAKAFQQLLKAQKRLGFHLTIRYLGELHKNGLKEIGSRYITYMKARPDLSTAQIDKADLVVGTQTFAYLGVARGKPTLFIDEDIPPKGGDCLENFAFIRDWDKLKDVIMYPLDLNKTDDPAALMKHACCVNPEVSRWRDRMIGEQFDPKRFSDIVSGYFQ